MSTHRLLAAGLVLSLGLSAGCRGSESDAREYPLQGQVLSVTENDKEANIKHEEIKGLMPAMTMPYKVRDASEFEGLAAGDLINATLVMLSNDAYLKDVRKVGNAPIERPPADAAAPAASSGFELLKEGAPVPATAFVDQDGRKLVVPDAFNGKALALTFVYTRCPMPTFCPLMDRNFVALQQKLTADPALNAHLLTISIDPEYDKPPVLKKHAAKLGADPRLWTFVTGDRDEIDAFAMRLGLSTQRSMTDQTDIAHTLRTAILDRQGNLVKLYTGNEWTPEQLMADIKVLVGVD